MRKMEWFLHEEDRGNPMIRVALNLDEGAMPEHGINEFGMSWEQLVMKKIEDNQRRMVEMNKELRNLAAMVSDGRQQSEQPSFFAADVHGEPDDDDVHDEPNDGDIHREVDEAAPCFDTVAYTDVGGCLDEDKDDLGDVASLLAGPASACSFFASESQILVQLGYFV
ncbi:hypothetical protein V8G54_026771 [Vigna mungo]|uniref:Uncharacterized protein n=1 Tax=Vigna mungo TaxID=3915 RepID=A0AAQ3N108_VIGMU